MKKCITRAVLTPSQDGKVLRAANGWAQAVPADTTGIAVLNIFNIESRRSKLYEDRAILLAEDFGDNPEIVLFPIIFERGDLEPMIRSTLEMLQHLSPES